MQKIIENAKKYAQDIFKNDFSGHDYFHTERVFHLATNLSKKENADVFICQLAALLHDVDDHKLSPATYPNKDNAREFLNSQNIDKEIIEKIITIIDEISFMGTDSKTPSTLEGMIVQDADRLDAIGTIGIARTFMYGGSKGNQMYNPDIPALLNMSAEEYKHQKNSTVINHFYEKLLTLKNLMNTETAKQIANHRHQLMEIFLEEFYKEWKGEIE